ncbi:hypothetical protein [Mesorhizobium sp.]|uniref:hypothetical protein n=1 Tax=Mesorhizobium sp. TaxID=1871066 RepID=UPI000FE3B1C4|nr:hypothetical protein [Mesorhizobium sp.]RWJ03480.1 MAG: hypothetical protein EOR24_32385 [Mesorhizobium sp.]
MNESDQIQMWLQTLDSPWFEGLTDRAKAELLASWRREAESQGPLSDAYRGFFNDLEDRRVTAALRRAGFKIPPAPSR